MTKQEKFGINSRSFLVGKLPISKRNHFASYNRTQLAVINPQKESVMSPPLGSLFLRAFGGETVEQIVKSLIEKKLVEAANRGESGRNIVLDVLQTFGSKESLGKFQKLPGFSIQILATAIGSFLETTDWIDKILPDDSHRGIKEAKFLLKSIAPHMIIGAGEGWNEAMERITDKVRSNPAKPNPRGIDAECDVMFVPSHRPDLGFTPVRNENGEIQYYNDGKTPRCKESAYQDFLREWNKDHGGRMVEKVEGGNKGGPPRTTKQVWKEPDPLEGTFIPLTEWIMSLPDNTPLFPLKVTEELKERVAIATTKSHEPPKPKSWSEKLTPETLRVMFALSRTKCQLSWMERVIGEDFFKDLPNKADIALMTAVGNEFAPRVLPDNTFSHIDYIACLEFMDDWMGAELTVINRLRLALGRMRANMRSGTNWKKALFVFLIATSPLWMYLIAFVSLFLTGAVLFIAGLFADTTQPFLGYAKGNISAYACVIVGAWTMIILLMTLAPAQAMITWVSAIVPGVDKDKKWLTDTSRKICAMIAPYGAFAALLTLFGVSVMWRALLPITALGSIGVVMIFGAAGFHERIRNEALTAGKWFKILTIITPFILIIVGAVFDGFDVKPISFAKDVFDFIKSTPWLRSLIGFAIVSVGGFLVVRELEITSSKTEDGRRTEVLRKQNPLMRLILFIFATLVAIFLWTGTSNGDTKNTDSETSVDSQTEEVKSGDSNQVKSSVRPRIKKKSGHVKKDPCEGMTYSVRKEMGCDK